MTFQADFALRRRYVSRWNSSIVFGADFVYNEASGEVNDRVFLSVELFDILDKGTLYFNYEHGDNFVTGDGGSQGYLSYEALSF